MQFENQTAVLPPGEFDPGAFFDGPMKDRHPKFRREHTIIIENRLDAHCTVQTLRPCDACYPNERRFACVYRLLLQDFQRKPLFEFHPRRAENCTN